jgi:Icc-related predicted phosphoesterase
VQITDRPADIATSWDGGEATPRNGGRRPLRLAATGDVHCSEERRGELAAGLADVGEHADVLLVAGDLTTHGEPSQAASFADICRTLDVPVFAVLGNHDWHVDRRDDVMAELVAGGIEVLEGAAASVELAGYRVGIAGAKGFVGGFSGASGLLADFGEPALRQLHTITSHEVEVLDRALREIADCEIRIALMHYSPIPETLVGEPEGIWPFLGSERLAAPIAEHRPDLVLHGHAHEGAARGSIDAGSAPVPVYNVSMATLKRPYTVFELHAKSHPPRPLPLRSGDRRERASGQTDHLG